MYPRSLLAAALVLLAFVIDSYALTQSVWGKDVPMGHPSLSISLRAGPDSRFDFFLADENSIEKLRDEMTKLYATIDTIVLPEIKKQFDEKKGIYYDGYIEYVSISYDTKESNLVIFISKQPGEYGCSTEGCALEKIDVVVPPELELSEIRQVGMFIGVYDTASEPLVERIQTKTSAEARILLTEASDVLKENKDKLLADGTPIESFFLRQYEDISRTTVMFSPFEPGGPAKQPIDVVDASNTYYKKANSGVLQNESSPNSAEEWNTAYVVGRFLNSDPPKPDQIFIVKYRANNSTVEKFNATLGFGTELRFGTNTERNGTLEVKFPRNYPYTNDYEYLSTGNYKPRGDINGIIVSEFDDPPYTIHSHGFGKYCIQICTLENVRKSTTDCFFIFSIPLKGRSEIGLAPVYLLWSMPHHGDEIAESCNGQTLVGPAPTDGQQRLCDKLNIGLEKCDDTEILKQTSFLENEKRVEEERNQISNSMYIIGVGAAFAGLLAFVMLRKR